MIDVETLKGIKDVIAEGPGDHSASEYKTQAEHDQMAKKEFSKRQVAIDDVHAHLGDLIQNKKVPVRDAIKSLTPEQSKILYEHHSIALSQGKDKGERYGEKPRTEDEEIDDAKAHLDNLIKRRGAKQQDQKSAALGGNKPKGD